MQARPSQRYPGSFLTNTVPSRQSATTPELIPSHRLRWPDASVRCPATGATIAMTMPAAAVNPPSSSDSRAGSPKAELDRYVLKTKVVATALNAENAQSQKPHATTAPRVGEVPPVTRRRLACVSGMLSQLPRYFPEGQPMWLVYLRNVDSGELAHLRRARDLLDREYAKPLNVPLMA